MNAAFLVTRLEKPSARYRVLQYLPYLKDQGWDTQVFTLPKRRSDRRELFRDLQSYDVVLLQKKLLSRWDFALLRKNAHHLIYDFDDAIMYRDTWSGRQSSLKRKWAFARTARRVDWVIAGNEYLRNLALDHNARVSVIPTPVPVNQYPIKDYGHVTTTVTLGWIGSQSTLNYLELIKEALGILADQFPSLRLKIVSDQFIHIDKIPLEKKKWQSDEEVSDLHSFDIGLMPLSDDLWSRGKCGFKILQYMAAGLPVVCSPVGVNREIIENGVQGFWAETQEQWVEKISALIMQPELRKQMGLEGRKRATDHYSLTANQPHFLKVLHSL